MELYNATYIVAHFKKRKYNFSMNALQQKRKELGITQIQAANACGVSRRTYQNYEEGNNQNATYEELISAFNFWVFFFKQLSARVFNSTNIRYEVRTI